jgi:hypothetical protein
MESISNNTADGEESESIEEARGNESGQETRQGTILLAFHYVGGRGGGSSGG